MHKIDSKMYTMQSPVISQYHNIIIYKINEDR